MATEAGTGPTKQETTAGPSAPITKGIILVHGMGDAKKGETLYRFFNPIVDYMTNRKRPASPWIFPTMIPTTSHTPVWNTPANRNGTLWKRGGRKRCPKRAPAPPLVGL